MRHEEVVKRHFCIGGFNHKAIFIASFRQVGNPKPTLANHCLEGVAAILQLFAR